MLDYNKHHRKSNRVRQAAGTVTESGGESRMDNILDIRTDRAASQTRYRSMCMYVCIVYIVSSQNQQASNRLRLHLPALPCLAWPIKIQRPMRLQVLQNRWVDRQHAFPPHVWTAWAREWLLIYVGHSVLFVSKNVESGTRNNNADASKEG